MNDLLIACLVSALGGFFAAILLSDSPLKQRAGEFEAAASFCDRNGGTKDAYLHNYGVETFRARVFCKDGTDMDVKLARVRP